MEGKRSKERAYGKEGDIKEKRGSKQRQARKISRKKNEKVLGGKDKLNLIEIKGEVNDRF